MQMRNMTACLIGSCVLCGGFLATEGATWHVAKDGSGDFTVIQDAVDAAASGDTIAIGAGRYDEYTTSGSGMAYVFLDGTKDLTFRGEGEDQTVIGPESYDPTFDVYGFLCLEGSPTLRLENLRIEHITGSAVRAAQASLELVACTIERCNQGLHVADSSDHVRIEACRFVDSTDFSVPAAVYAGPTDLQVVGTEFDRYGGGINLNYGTGLISGCTFAGGDVAAGGISLHGAVVTVENCHIADMRVYGIAVQDMNDLTMRDCVIESCLGDGMSIHGSNVRFDIQGCIIRDCAACMFVGGECYHPAIHGNHFLRDDASGGWYVRSPEQYPWGPKYFELTENYWGTTDIPTIAEWILDGYDQPDCLLYIVFEPIADGPVPVEIHTWSEVKGMFREGSQ